MNETLKLCFNLIKSEICQKPLDTKPFENLSVDDYKKLFFYSKGHDIAHIVGNSLIKNNLVSGEINNAFNKQVAMAYFRYQKIDFELKEAKRILIENNIPFIPLKGAVVRELYNEPWMRTSCDIDILLKEKDIDKAIELCAAGLGKTGKTGTTHDVGLITNLGMHIEMHYSLVDGSTIEQVDLPLQNVWDYAEQVNGTSEYKLKDEMFYYYHIAHMAKHLVEGGCGIRPFIDLYLLNRESVEVEKRESLLCSGGLIAFDKECKSLTQCIFNDKTPTELDESFANYVLDGGVYGNTENRTAIKSTAYKSKFGYILSRIWMPYEQLAGRYPKLKGKRILQPFYEMKRWCWMLTGGRLKRGAKEIKTNTLISQDKIESTQKLFNELDIKLKKK